MNKSTRNLLIVFVILIAVVYVFFKGEERITTQDIEEKLFAADSSKIDKIELVKKNETIVLEKVGGNWLVTKPINYPADTTTVFQMLSNLQNFKIESVASTNPEKFSNFLDSANPVKVTAYQEGKQLGSFEVGKFAITYENAYIKPADKNEILLATKLNQTNFNKTLKDYRNKLIASIPSYTLSKIEFKSIDSNRVDFAIVKDTSAKWTINNDSVPSVNIEPFLSLMNTFNTEDFLDSTITEFATPTYTIKLTSTTNQVTIINLYQVTDSPYSDYIIQVSNQKQLFKMGSGTAHQLKKTKKDFIPEKKPETKDGKEKQ